jgi:ABC-type multidrug transport system fused ATPase/permease subunit
MKRKLKSVRSQSRASSEKALQHLKEALNGYIESNIYNAHSFFKQRYGQFQIELNNHLAELQIVQGVPNRVIEIFAVLGLFILVVIGQWSGTSASLIIIGAFMAAAYKIIPGVVKILNAAAQVKAYEHTVIPDNANSIVIKQESQNKTPLNSVEFKSVRFNFETKNIFTDLSFCIQRGDFLGISGVSGKGKTTMLNLLLGFLDNEHGEIYFNKKIADAAIRKSFRYKISYAKQQAFLLHDTILRNITLHHDSYDHKKLAMSIQLSGLSEYIDSLPDGLLHVIDESGKNISGGQQKRITLARALYKDADLLILDEPFSELDEKSQKILLNNLRQLTGVGKMIMVVTHNKESLSFCTKQIILDEK